MPESDVIIAQAAVYLARAPKSREVKTLFLFQAVKLNIFLREFFF